MGGTRLERRAAQEPARPGERPPEARPGEVPETTPTGDAPPKAPKKPPAKAPAEAPAKKDCAKKGDAKKGDAKKGSAKERPFVDTPASRKAGPPRVAVFGAGIAGLTAAHELAERGFAVTVYEEAEDRRPDEWKRKLPCVDGERRVPEVRLGGLAATQYLGDERLRWFPGAVQGLEAKSPPVPPKDRPPTGEHGFRFFPAYYLHIWDMLQRIPVCDETGGVTPRTVYADVQRVITQAVTSADGRPSLVIPREAPRSAAEFFGSFEQVRRVGFSATDISTFFGRIARYLVTSPDRRASELEEISAYEFFVDPDPVTGRDRYQYSDSFSRYILDMPKVLAAFDSRWGDARTNLSTYVQLNMALDRYDSKADGVLSGPTTEAWFDNWYCHLRKLGVRFERNALVEIRLSPEDDTVVVHLKAGDPLRDWDYYVVATDGFTAEKATKPLRQLEQAELEIFRTPLPKPGGEKPVADAKQDGADGAAPATPPIGQRERALSTVLGLEGWATSAPPDADPRDPNRAPGLQDNETRDPCKIEELGLRPWDRYQILSGIQFYFDTEFQIVRGHIYFANSEWGLSAINQAAFWVEEPSLEQDGYASVMSVDIGDWNRPSSETGLAARESTSDEIATEVWRQIASELEPTYGGDMGRRQLPRPRWYAIDEFIEFGEGGRGEPVNNRAPYLIPIVGDWKNRPGGYPWNPHGSSSSLVPTEGMRAAQKAIGVWQARHGGYQVHRDRVVFAGTWCKTFTRMTTMEAACESGRHAVNAILDHYLYRASGGQDERDLPALSWRMPFGFVDQELSSPIRQPTPAGDYCFVFDCENREPADARPIRLLDGEYLQSGLPHPWRVWGIDNASAVMSSFGTQEPGQVYDPTLWIIEQLRQWRGLFDRGSQGVPGDGMTTRQADWKFGHVWESSAQPDWRERTDPDPRLRRTDSVDARGSDATGTTPPAPATTSDSGLDPETGRTALFTVEGLRIVPGYGGSAFRPIEDEGRRIGRRRGFTFNVRPTDLRGGGRPG